MAVPVRCFTTVYTASLPPAAAAHTCFLLFPRLCALRTVLSIMSSIFFLPLARAINGGDGGEWCHLMTEIEQSAAWRLRLWPRTRFLMHLSGACANCGRAAISSPNPFPSRMAARKIDGLPLEMNRLFPTFPSLPSLNHFAAAAPLPGLERQRPRPFVLRARADWLWGARGMARRGKGEGGRATRKEKMSNKSPDIGSHFTRRQRRGGGDHF